MGEVRACVYISVIFLCFQICAAKPFFFGTRLWCDLLCDDDDISTTAMSGSLEDDDWCSGCPPSRPRPPTTPAPPVPPPPPPMQRQPVTFMMSPSNGMNLTMIPFNGGVELNLMPWTSAPGAPGGAASPPAGATTAAPAATTAAGAAAAATTVAPTTVAAGK